MKSHIFKTFLCSLETAMSAMSRQECFDINSLQSIITEFRHHPERFLSVQNLQLILDGLGEPTDSKTIEEWIKFYDQNDKGGIELVGFLQMVLDQILPIEDTEVSVHEADFLIFFQIFYSYIIEYAPII